MIRLATAAAAAALLLTAAAPALAQSADTSKVVLTFETGAATGSVMVALFGSEAAYNGGAPVAQAAVSASGAVVARFENLPAGDYAMRAFHDVNGNGQMDTNPFGMPTEPYAFSNNARGNMGPAS
ncbi:DUF2141 domain-containing protein [Brevundimonas sp. TWP2-3-4b2]|uniref:DUF2141 domain-containing protein n=1 Tax=Brevundimonas sp. TWP2-3-4b2 TaxID=2804595 RepID=UPI003CF16D04